MLPTETPQEEYYFNQEIRFKILNKEFTLSFKVKKIQE